MLNKLGGGEISWVKCPYVIQVRTVGLIKPVERTDGDQGQSLVPLSIRGSISRTMSKQSALP
jgi:hypothetical protein